MQLTTEDSQIKYSKDQLLKSKQISKQNMEIVDPYVFELCNERFLIMPKVFSPILFPSARAYYPKFPWLKDDVFLDIGCGAGYDAVLAIKNGAKKVVAVDINPNAVFNTKLNIQLHKVEEKVEVIVSDLFSNVEGKFTTIYWNHPFITAPEDFNFDNIVERAIFDPGYKLLEKFIIESHKYLEINGRLLLGLADVGGLDYFFELAKVNNYNVREVISEPGIEGNEIVLKLYELKLNI